MASIWQYRGAQALEKLSFSKDVLDLVDGSPLLAKLLANRGITQPDDIKAFLNLDAYQPGNGYELPDMDIAVARILKAIDQQEAILIYGDFDVDGITGTSILYETLKKHLNANVSFYIPDRATEGHGLNTAALVRLTSTRKVKLVITTDTGITNFAEVSLLNGLGVDTIITDHHALPENLPPAVANINSQRLLTEVDPNHPMGWMCGAGVAYKLCELLLEKKMPDGAAQRIAESLLDIVAVGTVVDMVPLRQENRYLVYRGLQVLNRKQRPGFNEILAQAGVKPEATITAETLGFTIGPRLNALGRLERADQGVELITGDDPERLRRIAAHLEYLNQRRRDLCDQTYLEAEAHLQKQGGLDDKRAIILASPDWNPGIIGIVASRLIEKYHVPVFLMVVDADKGEVRCSARSIPGFHLHDELTALSDYFLGFGGHAGAGGFALKLARLDAFKRDLHAICRQKITDEQMRPVIEVDAKLEWSQMHPHLLTLIDKLAPFGMENPSPKFVLENVNVAAQRFMGEGERHLKLVLTNPEGGKGQTNTPLEGVMWNVGNKIRFDARLPYSFAVVPSLNHFNGVTKLQLLIEDYTEAGKANQSITTAPRQVSTSSPKANPHATTPQPSSLEIVSNIEAATPTGPSAAIELSNAADTMTQASVAAASGTTEVQWIDHRGRESVELLISQLITPGDKKSLGIYHEGKKPEIPFLDATLLHGRNAVQSVDVLVFWDLPPSFADLQMILQTANPRTVHWVGGKYQSVPVFQPEQSYLKLILQVLRRGPQTQTLIISEFASQLATSEGVILNGLLLLKSLQLLTLQLKPENGLTQVEVQLPSELNAAALAGVLPTSLEFALFQDALKAVGKFRSWLLKAPIPVLKSSIAQCSHLPPFVVNSSTVVAPFDIDLKSQTQPEMPVPVVSL